MSRKTHVVAGIEMKTTGPTHLSFQELFTWTIWQFPRRSQGGLIGAVHPPLAKHGWFPAIIHVKEKQAHVHAHLETTFASPEAAMEHFSSGK